jgi:hypothetical protein
LVIIVKEQKKQKTKGKYLDAEPSHVDKKELVLPEQVPFATHNTVVVE